MRMIVIICLASLFFSCSDQGKEIENMHQLNQRINELEKRIDSLIADRNMNLIALSNTNNSNAAIKSAFLGVPRCQTITRKGTQCRRKARNNNYCWQHAE